MEVERKATTAQLGNTWTLRRPLKGKEKKIKLTPRERKKAKLPPILPKAKLTCGVLINETFTR